MQVSDTYPESIGVVGGGKDLCHFFRAQGVFLYEGHHLFNTRSKRKQLMGMISQELPSIAAVPKNMRSTPYVFPCKGLLRCSPPALAPIYFIRDVVRPISSGNLAKALSSF